MCSSDLVNLQTSRFRFDLKFLKPRVCPQKGASSKPIVKNKTPKGQRGTCEHAFAKHKRKEKTTEDVALLCATGAWDRSGVA